MNWKLFKKGLGFIATLPPQQTHTLKVTQMGMPAFLLKLLATSHQLMFPQGHIIWPISKKKKIVNRKRI